MTPEVVEVLKREKLPEEFHKILTHCKDLVDNSRNFMSKFYDKWDERLRVYASERLEDKKDRAKRANNEPTKMVVPMSSAQVNTFVAFLMALYNQRARFFEFGEVGAEDQQIRECSEVLVERDLQVGQFDLTLNQFLLNLARLGFGAFKESYTVKKRKIKQAIPVTNENGDVTGTTVEWVEVVDFEGNAITNVSPYKFFPDTRLPLTRFQEGEFCACEEEHPRISLQKQEAQGEVAGIQWVKQLADSDVQVRRNVKSRFSFVNLDKTDTSESVLILTELQVWLTPNEFEIEPGKFLGEEDFPVLYLVWYVNDQRIVRIEPMNSAHDKFNFECHQFTPDEENQINDSLVGNIEKLQEVIDWLINARVSATVRTLDHQLVVDPNYVDMDTVQTRSRVIKMKKNTGRNGIDRYIQPLPVQDVTGNNFSDAREVSSIMQQVTGVNENATGQYHTGRRSATEAKTVAQGAASRLVWVAGLVWTGALQPLGWKMQINHRAFLSQETFTRVIGPKKLEAQPELYSLFSRPITELAGSYDFFVFDGTTSGEKAYLAQSYQELLGILLSNPGAALSLGLDVNKLLQEIYVLRGAPNLQSFALEPEKLAQLQMIAQQQAAQQNVATQPEGAPTA